MKIGFDISDLSTNRADGTTRYTAELARYLPRIGQTQTWQMYAPADSPAVLTATANNQNVIKAISPWPKYWTQLRLPLELYKYQPEVLFMPIQQLPYLRPKSIKTIAVIHDLAFHYYPQQFTYKDWALLHIFSAYAAREADEIIAVSKATAADIGYYYGRRHNVHVIHHGVNHEAFFIPSITQKEEARRKIMQHYPAIKKPFLLYVGQIQPRKNLTRLITAFEELNKDDSLQLVIAGGHGWLQQPILKSIKNSAQSKNIIMLDRVPDESLLALYWLAEVFVLPSLYEGFGMPILEAMASGCPVVTSNVSSMPEVAGGAAVLVDPSDPGSICAGIVQALANQQQLRQQGQARSQEFNWQKTAAQTYQVITNNF